MTISNPPLAPPLWEGVPEVICTGTPYEIGFSHGSQVSGHIKTCIKNYKVLFLETAEADWEESRQRASKFVEPLTSNAPEMITEMRGIAVGASVDFLDILTLNLRSEIALTNYSDGCTAVGKVDLKTGTTLIAQNWDWVSEASQTLVFFDIHETGKPRMRMLGEAGLVGKFGFNEHGVGVMMNAIRSGSLATNKLPVHVAIRKILECKSYHEAVKMLETRGVASCVNFLIVDRNGGIGTLECSPKGNTIIAPEASSGTVCHTNHLYATDLPKGLKDHPSKNSFSRLARAKLLAPAMAGSVDGIRNLLSDKEGTPVSIDRSKPSGATGVERMETLATIIIDLRKLEAQITFGQPSLKPPVRTISIGY